MCAVANMETECRSVICGTNNGTQVEDLYINMNFSFELRCFVLLRSE
jgi:hypothetical protein